MKFLQPLELLSKFQSFSILDVRSLSEYQKSHILNAFHFPFDFVKEAQCRDILHALDSLSLKQQIVIHCRLSLIRGPDSYQKLLDCTKYDQIWKSTQFYLLEGGFKAWETKYPFPHPFTIIKNK